MSDTKYVPCRKCDKPKDNDGFYYCADCGKTLYPFWPTEEIVLTSSDKQGLDKAQV